MEPLVESDIGHVGESQVLDFITGILDGECGLNVQRRLARSVHRYFAEFQPASECFVALKRGDAIRGLVAVDRQTDEKAILKWFFVAPEERNNGLGARLLDRAVRFARDRGYGKLVLGTMRRMDAAQHLYRKYGFVYRQQVTFWGRPMMVYEKELALQAVAQDAAGAQGTAKEPNG